MRSQFQGKNFTDINYDVEGLNIRLYVEYKQLKHVVYENVVKVKGNHNKESIDRINVNDKKKEVA